MGCEHHALKSHDHWLYRRLELCAVHGFEAKAGRLDWELLMRPRRKVGCVVTHEELQEIAGMENHE